ncbi:MAG: DUF4199 domain-containing protein [Gammaproteobacteria bacterium]|nr:DUF4199 domain-containing protein [Gammaproteobacteria bacterium]
MFTTTLKYGGLAIVILIGITGLSAILLEQGPANYTTGEIIGYSAMLCALAMITLAHNEWRRHESAVKFWHFVIIGLGISTLAATAFGLYNLAYIHWFNPEFMEQYYQFYIESVRASAAPAAEIEAVIAQLEAEKSMWMQPSMQFFGMFLTVFVMGLLVTLVSSGFFTQLQKRRR